MEASVCPTVLLVDIYGLASLSSRKLPTMYGPLTTKASSLAQPIACPCRQHGAGSLDITRQLTDNATYMRTEAPLLNGHPVQDVWWWWWWWGATNPKPAYSRICRASTSSKLISITPSSCAGRLKGGPPPQGDADQGHYTWLAEEAPSPCGVR